jgi:hypothetical protein
MLIDHLQMTVYTFVDVIAPLFSQLLDLDRLHRDTQPKRTGTVEIGILSPTYVRIRQSPPRRLRCPRRPIPAAWRPCGWLRTPDHQRRLLPTPLRRVTWSWRCERSRESLAKRSTTPDPATMMRCVESCDSMSGTVPPLIPPAMAESQRM